MSAGGDVGDFVESTVVPWGLVRGRFVTVDCLHEGKRQIAREIIVLEPEAPAHGQRPRRSWGSVSVRTGAKT